MKITKECSECGKEISRTGSRMNAGTIHKGHYVCWSCYDNVVKGGESYGSDDAYLESQNDKEAEKYAKAHPVNVEAFVKNCGLSVACPPSPASLLSLPYPTLHSCGDHGEGYEDCMGCQMDMKDFDRLVDKYED